MMKRRVRITTTDAEIDAAIVEAAVRDGYRPKDVSATYREDGDTVAVTLASGIEVVVPRELLQGLENATSARLRDVQIVGAQSGLHWEALDVDHSIPGLLEGIFGNREWMGVIGKKGGSARSEAQTRAVRENGRKGGRPKEFTA